MPENETESTTLAVESTAPEAAVEVETKELAPLIPASRLPALTSAGVTLEVFQQVKGYKGMILASPTDKDGYKKIEAARKFTNQVIANVKKGCMEGRRPHIDEQNAWIEFERKTIQEFKPIVEELEKQAEIFEKAEEARRQEAQRLLRQKIQSRLDSLAAINRRPDYDKATTFTDEQWDEFFASEKKLWEEENQQRAEADRLRQLGKSRAAEMAGFDVVVEAEDIAQIPEDKYQLILADAKKAFDAEQERKRLENVAKEAKLTRYRERVALLAAIEIVVAAEDVQIVSDMNDDEWKDYLADETEMYTNRKRQEAEKARLDALLAERLQKLSGKIDREISNDERDKIRAMADSEFEDFFLRVVSAYNERVESARKDNALRVRMTALSPFGTNITTELGTKLREMSDEEWTKFFNDEQDAHDQRKQEQERNAALAKTVVVEQPVDLEPVQIQNLFPEVTKISQEAVNALIKEWNKPASMVVVQNPVGESFSPESVEEIRRNPAVTLEEVPPLTPRGEVLEWIERVKAVTFDYKGISLDYLSLVRSAASEIEDTLITLTSKIQ